MARKNRRIPGWARCGLAGAAMAIGATASYAETLADALVGAYNHSGVLEQQRAVLRASDESVALASAALLPVLRWQADFQRTVGDARSLAGTSNLEQTQLIISLIASWQVYDFGADAARKEAAKETVLATRAGLLQIEQQIMEAAVTAFMNVRATAETVSIRESNIRLLTQELRAANDRFEVGEVTRTDVSLAQAALAAARSDLAAAKADFQQSRESYRVAVGRYPKALSAPPRLPRVERNVDRARAIAVRNHPAMRQAQHQVASAELSIVAAEADMKPTVSLQGTLRSADDIGNSGGSESLTLGVRGQQTIYQGGQLSALARQEVARRDQARNNLHVVRHDIYADVGNSYADLQAAIAQIEASNRRIKAARVAFDGVREEAKLGARTTLDVLDAEQQLLDAQAAKVQAEALQYIAAYGVLSSMGLLTAEQLKLPVQIYDPSAYYDLVKDGVAKKSRQGKRLDRVLKALNK